MENGSMIGIPERDIQWFSEHAEVDLKDKNSDGVTNGERKENKLWRRIWKALKATSETKGEPKNNLGMLDGLDGFSLMKDTEEFPKSLLPSFTLRPWDIIKKILLEASSRHIKVKKVVWNN